MDRNQNSAEDLEHRNKWTISYLIKTQPFDFLSSSQSPLLVSCYSKFKLPRENLIDSPSKIAWNKERGVLKSFCSCCLVFSLRKIGSDAEQAKTTTGQY